MSALSEAEIARRLPVWTALSELFLDTEPQDNDFRYIADQLQESGYSLTELHKIFSEEVAPVFFANLCTMAGQWTPWSVEFVRQRILEHLSKRPSIVEHITPRAWLHSRRDRFVQEQWDVLRKLLESRQI